MPTATKITKGAAAVASSALLTYGAVKAIKSSSDKIYKKTCNDAIKAMEASKDRVNIGIYNNRYKTGDNTKRAKEIIDANNRVFSKVSEETKKYYSNKAKNGKFKDDVKNVARYAKDKYGNAAYQIGLFYVREIFNLR